MPQLRSPRIWGTFAASGGVGATTIAINVARIAAHCGFRTLLAETDYRAPAREILSGQPPFWQEYRVGSPIPVDALPRISKAGCALLTVRGSAPPMLEMFTHVLEEVREHFDIIIVDKPLALLPDMEAIVVAENSLISLIGINSIFSTYKPRITVVNKFSPKIKKHASIEDFATDSKIFRIPKSSDLHLTLGLGITRKLSKQNEKILAELLNEMLS